MLNEKPSFHSRFLVSFGVFWPRQIAVMALLASCFSMSLPAVSDDIDRRYHFFVPQQELDQALLELSSQAGVNILGLSSLLENLTSQPVSGEMTLHEALEKMLVEIGVTFEVTDTGAVVIRPEPQVPNKKEVIVQPDSEPEAARPHEILVTGIRESLRAAAEFKKEASVVVDLVTAEDVGKFPDPNVAEALQRVTGVQISRDRGGDGRWVSIRGLSSQYNMTTLNGRTLATDNAGRDFSFDVMPAEVISRAKVYKTSMASLPEGSIGGLVDLITTSPLDNPGFRSHGSVGAFYDGATENWTEQVSLHMQDSYLEDTVGVSFGASYYKRDWQSDTYESFVSSMEAVDSNGDGIRDEAIDGRGAFPGIVSFQKKFGERERLGLTGALEFRPSEKFKTALDFFYSDFRTPESAYAYNINFYSNEGWRRFENATLEPYPGNEMDRWLITSFDLSDIPVEIGNDTKARKAITYMVGSNSHWQVNQDLSFTLDWAYSEADRPINGTEFFTVAGVDGGNFTYRAGGKVPKVSCTFEDGSNCLEVNNDDIGLHFLEPKGENVNDQVQSIRLDGTYRTESLDYVEDIEFGLSHSKREKQKVDWRPRDPCAFCGFGETLGEVGVDAVVPFPGSYSYNSGFEGWPALDPLALFEAARRHGGDEFFESRISPEPQLRSSFAIEESVVGSYLQLNLAGDDWYGNVGVRWAATEVISTGHTQLLLSLREVPNSTNWTPTFTDVIPVAEFTSYANILPSANLAYELNPSLLLRGSVSRSITRPTLLQLGPDIAWEVNSPPPRMVRNGNPALRPFVADSLDLSLEWYGENGSSAAAAVFFKDLDGLITSEQLEDDLSVKVIGVDGAESDQILEFDVTAPVNGTDAKIHGAEFAWQYLFDNGFGIMANLTWVDSDARLSSAEEQANTALSGVSEYTYNLVGFYEKAPLSGRLAWNYRDDFIACNTCAPAQKPTITAAFGSLDFSVSYDLNENSSIYFEGQNLLKEDNHTYAQDPRITQSYEAYSRRFEMGYRFTF